MTDERHTYTRFTFRPDGSTHIETVTLTGDDVRFRHAMGRSDRLAALELVNRWNRAVSRHDYANNHYVYVLDPPAPTQDN